MGWAWLDSAQVGALSFGGGFVIVPTGRGGCLHVYDWMTNTQFLDAVALGQVTRSGDGDGRGGRLCRRGRRPARRRRWSPSHRRSVRVRGRAPVRAPAEESPGPRSFLDGAGPAAIGAIFGAGITLAGALTQDWQFAVLAAAVRCSCSRFAAGGPDPAGRRARRGVGAPRGAGALTGAMAPVRYG